MPVFGFKRHAELRGSGVMPANAAAKSHGFVAWTFDPIHSNQAGTQANTHLVGVLLEEGEVITGLSVPVSVAGASMTFAQLGIYDESLNLLVSTPNSPSAFQTTGWISVNFSAPFVVPATGLYYLASGFTGTTLPTVINSQQQSATSVNLPGGARPRGVHAQVPSGALPNPAVSQGSFTGIPLIVAF